MIEARYRGETGPMVVATGLVRDYPSGDDVVHALRGVDLRVDRGQLVAVRIGDAQRTGHHTGSIVCRGRSGHHSRVMSGGTSWRIGALR